MNESDEIIQACRIGRLTMTGVMADEANLRADKRQKERIDTLYPEDWHSQQHSNAEREQRINDEEPPQCPPRMTGKQSAIFDQTFEFTIGAGRT